MTTTSFHRTGRLLEREPLVDSDQVWFQPIGRGAWRVLDNRLPLDDVRALLGFVERIDEGVAVTLLDEPGAVSICPSLERARHVFVRGPGAGPTGR